MIRYKTFKDYDAYIEKQGGKITYKLKELLDSRPQRIAGFEKLFTSTSAKYLVPGRMLCLGARTGCEVQAARNVGFKNSIGVDLHPVGDLVIQGDWHSMPFFDKGSFSNVFTNALDHCYDLPELVKEIKRVLHLGGTFYFMVMQKMALQTVKEKDIEAYINSKPYDSMFWDTEKDIIDEFTKMEFIVKSSWRDNKWVNYCLKNQ